MALLHVDDDFKVEFELLLAVDRLFEAHLGVLEFLDNFLLLTLKMQDKVSQVAKTLLILGLESLHLDSDLPLVDNAVELFVLDLGKHMPVAFKVIHLLLLHLRNLFIDQLSIDLIVRVVDTDMGFHLFLLLGWHNNSAILLACLDEANDLARVQILMHANCLQASFLLGKALVVLHPLVELGVLVITNVNEIFFRLEYLLLLKELVVVLNHVCCRLLHVM